jgi:hypothetical protein
MTGLDETKQEQSPDLMTAATFVHRSFVYRWIVRAGRYGPISG